MKRLAKEWTGGGWPKRLNWLAIAGLRGWTGQRVEFRFPITAIIGENGVGKSTVLQCAAAVYQGTGKFASDYFPATHWDKLKGVHIGYGVMEGSDRGIESEVHRPSDRWRGNPRRRQRHVAYIDLSRVQPVAVRTGYARLAKSPHREVSSRSLDGTTLARLGQIMGRRYDAARLATTDLYQERSDRDVPVLAHLGVEYSGFHGGAGETTALEFLQAEVPKTGLIIIDEIETSLHPRAQRRLMRDLATLCRERDVQVILSTHSQVILDELPPEARVYIAHTSSGRQILPGVSPEFAMTKMDEVPHHECDVYVEDPRAATLLTEILVAYERRLVEPCQIIPYGASSVGAALGQMVYNSKFPRPSCVFMDGDASPAKGCTLLPGDGAPEEVIFGALRDRGWAGLADKIARDHSEVADACVRAMTLEDEHNWVRSAASELTIGGDILWQAMCALWAKTVLTKLDADPIIAAIYAVLPATRVDAKERFAVPPPPPALPPIRQRITSLDPSAPMLPFAHSPPDGQGTGS
jgi:predicted ATPase